MPVTVSVRIIPARAGFTGARRPQARQAPDHPRSRGVYAATSKSVMIDSGSSPLARGLLRCQRRALLRHGIIPARAGFTGRPASHRLTETDHPRSRGVYSPDASPRRTPRGSSPLARGLHRPAHEAGAVRGIIPARAGFTTSTTATTPATTDHPRSRGVYPGEIGGSAAGGGSSPLARGLRRCSGHRRLNARIIPARAGFTGTSRGCPRAGPDHPRSRGVYSAA